MDTRSTVRLIIMGIILITLLVGAFYRSKTLKSVKNILTKADSLENSGDVKGAISLYKEALGMTISRGTKGYGTIGELREMMNMTGWFLVQKLKTAYSKENVLFDIQNWKEIVGELNSKSDDAPGKKYAEKLIQLYNDLP